METNLSTNNIYFNEMGKFSLLSKEEEIALANKIAEGDKEARDKLITANLRFVIKVAEKYQGFGLSMEELIGAGNIGLVIAADKFKPSSNTKFTTYAVWWIRDSIQKAIRGTALGVKFPAENWEEIKDEKWHFASLDKPIGKSDSEDTSFGSLLENNQVLTAEQEFYNDSIKMNIRKAVSQLSTREQTIINLRYGLTGEKSKSYSEIGKIIGISKERVRQIETSILPKLRAALKYDDSSYYTLAA